MILKKSNLDLSIILPTYNEEKNISILLNDLISSFAKTSIRYQIIITDGCSNDNTINDVLNIKKDNQNVDIIILQSIIRKDITSSVLSGIEASFGKYIAVMDSDGQHRVIDLLQMYDYIKEKNKDLIVGSRNLYTLDDNILKSKRKKISVLVNKALNLLFNFNLSDPLSGFFVLNRDIIVPKIFHNEISGFKVLFHIIVNSSKKKKITEYPINFQKRMHGVSKLDFRVGYYFLIQIITYIIPFNLPFKFVSFLFIGSVGATLHMSIFYISFQNLNIFYISHLIALFFASILNFFLNNYLTFSDNKLIGKKAILSGALIYVLISIITIAGSTFISTNIFYYGISAYIATILGALIDSVFKYITVQKFIWKK